ncbi:ACHB protein, partial [Geococcyx californianus]|nr:ACHB protein [Geococcyx californianus]
VPPRVPPRAPSCPLVPPRASRGASVFAWLQVREQWRVAALVLDRLCLGGFLALTAACALGTALDAALHRPPPQPFP